MYDIEELEKKWLKYRRRKVAIIVSSVILVTSITGGISYLIVNGIKNKSTNKSVEEANKQVQKNTNIDEDVIVRRGSSNKGNISSNQEHRREVETPSNINQNDYRDNDVHKSELNLIITSPKNGTVVQEIEKRFRESKNYDDAIYLAEYFYSHKKYKKAEYWAMQANIVDSIPEDSWIIFAKAKVKSGHRLEALKVLEAYYNKTGSTNALDLIDAIRKNRKF